MPVTSRSFQASLVLDSMVENGATYRVFWWENCSTLARRWEFVFLPAEGPDFAEQMVGETTDAALQRLCAQVLWLDQSVSNGVTNQFRNGSELQLPHNFGTVSLNSARADL